MLPQLGENQVQDEDAWTKPMNLAPDWNNDDPEVRESSLLTTYWSESATSS